MSTLNYKGTTRTGRNTYQTPEWMKCLEIPPRIHAPAKDNITSYSYILYKGQ